MFSVVLFVLSIYTTLSSDGLQFMNSIYTICSFGFIGSADLHNSFSRISLCKSRERTAIQGKSCVNRGTNYLSVRGTNYFSVRTDWTGWHNTLQRFTFLKILKSLIGSFSFGQCN